MALELETIIMEEIGLGNHYHWYNGSGSCMHIRIQATDKLAEAIQTHAKVENAIAMPDKSLIQFAKNVAGSSLDSPYELTRTWEVCSYVIAAHIHEAESPGAIQHTLQYLQNNERFRVKDRYIHGLNAIYRAS